MDWLITKLGRRLRGRIDVPEIAASQSTPKNAKEKHRLNYHNKKTARRNALARITG